MSESKISLIKGYRENRMSTKTNKSYQVLVLKFNNGYTMDVFLNNEQQYILGNEIPLNV